MNLTLRVHVNNKADVFDELDVVETLSVDPPEPDSERAASGIDIVDSISRAAFKRRIDFIRYGVRVPSKSIGSHHLPDDAGLDTPGANPGEAFPHSVNRRPAPLARLSLIPGVYLDRKHVAWRAMEHGAGSRPEHQPEAMPAVCAKDDEIGADLLRQVTNFGGR